jgi:hypothetical protein
MNNQDFARRRKVQALAGWAVLFSFVLGCQWMQDIAGGKTAVPPPTQTRLPSPTSKPTSTPETPLPTRTCTRTPRPAKTPTAEYKYPCIYGGPPEAFEPAEIPELLAQSDEAIFRQSSLWTETDIDYFSSFGSATFGTEIEIHSECHERIPSPEILSYCKFTTLTYGVRVITGEVQGTPQKTVNESLVRGKEGWMRQEGGQWQQTWMLSDSDVENAAEAYKNSPFFYQMKEDCQTDEDFPDLTGICFSVNLPKFLETALGKEISYVECVIDDQGILWIDPQTSLPKQLTIGFNSAVRYPDQKSSESAYNAVVEMKVVYKAFNEEFTYPNPA